MSLHLIVEQRECRMRDCSLQLYRPRHVSWTVIAHNFQTVEMRAHRRGPERKRAFVTLIQNRIWEFEFYAYACE